MKYDEVLAFFGERLQPRERESLESWLGNRARVLHIFPSDNFEIQENAKLYGRTKTFTVSWHKHTHIVTLSILRKKNVEVVDVKQSEGETVLENEAEACQEASWVQTEWAPLPGHV
jgi:hypothetical protein